MGGAEEITGGDKGEIMGTGVTRGVGVRPLSQSDQ
jgi:hypothetical protein